MEIIRQTKSVWFYSVTLILSGLKLLNSICNFEVKEQNEKQESNK